MATEKKLTKRSDSFSKWYQEVIKTADLAEHSQVKGCMVIKPHGYAIWETIKSELDQLIKKEGVENLYFPMLIPEKLLHKEEEHVEGFAPEVAVVTYAGGEKLNQGLVLRPTSETVMYQTFSKWIESEQDLPLLVNQWANVIRWELRPRLFLRTTEFLWQEGHTVHSSFKEADDMAQKMLGIYKKLAKEWLAIPVITGMKSEREKFAGAEHTYTLEAMMQDGKALQLATSHNLGQNFSKVFNISFADSDGHKKYGWQTSWGLSTRVIGALIMTHSDDTGLVLPPKLAPVQVVIVPIYFNYKQEKQIVAEAKKLQSELIEKDIRVEVDLSDKHPGDKYYHWERKGVPLRIEIGPKDMDNKKITFVCRDNEKKDQRKRSDIVEDVPKLLDDTHQRLYEKAANFQLKNTVTADSWTDFKKEIRKNHFVTAFWDGDAATEERIKQETKATIRCLPQSNKTSSGNCVYTGKKTDKKAIFAIAY